MNRMGELEVKGGSLTYLINTDEVQVENCHVREAVFEIPDRIENLPVTVISKKAFLGKKSLTELVLPEDLREAGDWSFAHCDRLEKVYLKRKPVSFGKGAFKDCRKLHKIYFKKDINEKLAGLLAMAPVMLDAEYLLSPMEAGESTWLEKLDARLFTLLEKPDEEGYLKQVLCGEEDLMASMEVYLAGRRKEKAELCYRRLLNDIGLKEDGKRYLQDYLKQNTKGCEYEAAWEVVWKEHGQEQEYYQAFADAGCINAENFDALLFDMGENNPEMKAWLLRYREENMSSGDFFDRFSLD
ncbi:MAG: leucine-rich repeat protein [Suilimivivens sp.]